MNASLNIATVADEKALGVPTLTEEILWKDYLADIADTIAAHLPISERELKRLRKLRPLSSVTNQFRWYADRRDLEFKLILQSDGPLWLFDYSRDRKFSQEVRECLEDLRDYRNTFVEAYKAL